MEPEPGNAQEVEGVLNPAAARGPGGEPYLFPHPQVIRYRSVEPVLTPTLPQECSGTVAHVVFPTGIDRRDDLGLPNRFDVYYGMADSRIGVARLDIPDVLPPGGVADPPQAKV